MVVSRRVGGYRGQAKVVREFSMLPRQTFISVFTQKVSPLTPIRYSGNFKEDEFHGRGKQFYEVGSIKYDGLYSKATNYFKGKEYKENGLISYDGELLNYKAHGQGRHYHEGLLTYEGFFENNQLCGFGTLYHMRSTVKEYVGFFKNDEFNGYGEKFDYCGQLLCKAYWKDHKIERMCLTEYDLENGYEILDIEGDCTEEGDKTYIGETKGDEPSGWGTLWINS